MDTSSSSTSPAGATPEIFPTFTHYGAIDWDEFFAVVRGEGAVAKERVQARVRAWDDGTWVREAASAHAAKHATRMAAE